MISFKKLLIIITMMIGTLCQSAYAGDWTKRYIKDAFGDSDYSQPVYTVDLNGTTNIIREGEKCVLGLMVKPEKEFALSKAFLMRNGDNQNFFDNTKVFVKLSNGKKYEIPCNVNDNGDVIFGTTIQECNAVLDILNNGNFTLAIQSSNMFGDRMTCTFYIGRQTTGIKNLISK